MLDRPLRRLGPAVDDGQHDLPRLSSDAHLSDSVLAEYDAEYEEQADY